MAHYQLEDRNVLWPYNKLYCYRPSAETLYMYVNVTTLYDNIGYGDTDMSQHLWGPAAERCPHYRCNH